MLSRLASVGKHSFNIIIDSSLGWRCLGWVSLGVVVLLVELSLLLPVAVLPGLAPDLFGEELPAILLVSAPLTVLVASRRCRSSSLLLAHFSFAFCRKVFGFGLRLWSAGQNCNALLVIGLPNRSWCLSGKVFFGYLGGAVDWCLLRFQASCWPSGLALSWLIETALVAVWRCPLHFFSLLFQLVFERSWRPFVIDRDLTRSFLAIDGATAHLYVLGRFVHQSRRQYEKN